MLLRELGSNILSQLFYRPGTGYDHVPILLGYIQIVALVAGLVTSHLYGLNLGTQLVL